MKKTGGNSSSNKKIVSPKRRLPALWLVEVFIYIAFSFYAFIATTAILSAYSLVTDSSLWAIQVVVIIISVILAYAFNYVLFDFAAKHLSPHISGKKSRSLIALLLVSLVLWIVLSSLPTILNSAVVDQATVGYFFVATAALLIMCFADAVAFGIIPLKSSKDWKNDSRIPYLLLFVFTAIILSSIPLSYQKNGTLSAPWQFVDAMASLTIIPASIFDLFLSDLSTLVVLDPATRFKIFAALLGVLALIGIWLFISAKKIETASGRSWRRAGGIALFLYCAYILLPFDKVQEMQSDWSMPAVNIQKEIEQDQQGMLFPALLYMEQATGGYGTYMACRDGNIFTILQSSNNSGNYFQIDTNNVPPEQTPAITPKSTKDLGSCTKEYFPSQGTFPPGFECIKNPDAQPQTYTDEQGKEITYSDCTNLSYNGHKLFNQDGHGNVLDIELSDNKEWAAIQTDASQIYLLDLRGWK